MTDAESRSASAVEAFKNNLFIHAKDGPGEVSSAMAASVSSVFGDFYLDANYGLRGQGASIQAPSHVFIVPGAVGDSLFTNEINYGLYASAVLQCSNDEAIDSKWFGSIEQMANFVRAVAYEAAGLDWHSAAGYDAPPSKPMAPGQSKENEENKPAVRGVFGTPDSTGAMVAATAATQRASRAYSAILAKTIIDVGQPASQSTADSRFNALRLWLAYQYIDHAPVKTEGDYDSFLEVMVRQLTKVVFVAKLLHAAFDKPYMAGSIPGKADEPCTGGVGLGVAGYFIRVLSLPYNDETMLGPFLDSTNDKQYLDNMYMTNVTTSARLYKTAQELEKKDGVMRRVQDNLRSINTNDELIRVARFRAYVLYILTWVCTVLLAASLYFAYQTGRTGTMYTVVAVVAVLVLLIEAFRGVQRIVMIAV